MPTLRGYRPPGVAADLLGLGLVAALLVAIHALVPPSIQAGFAFRGDLGRPETLLSSAYLHVDADHLAGNLVGYAAAAVYAYLLCLFAGERRWFRLTTLCLLSVLPVLVTLTSHVAWSAAFPGVDLPPSRGFSGVAAGFGGFLVVALLAYLRTEYSRRTVRDVGLVALLVVLFELLVIYGDSPPVAGGALALAGIGLTVADVVGHGYPGGVPGDPRGWLRLAGGILQVALVLLTISILVSGLFPARIVEDGTVTNVYAHLSGFAWGAVIAGWGYRYWKRT